MFIFMLELKRAEKKKCKLAKRNAGIEDEGWQQKDHSCQRHKTATSFCKGTILLSVEFQEAHIAWVDCFREGTHTH